ncbi:MAG: hypothetical protein K1X71_00110 [Pirellulales bacterium]|nr:hypothetical protein [Pirellulales bacterium]
MSRSMLVAASIVLCAGALSVCAWGQGATRTRRSASATDSQSPTLDRNEMAARQKILNSPEWHEVEHAFNEWLSVQRVYPASQVPNVKAEFKRRVRTATAAELQSWLDEMSGKLQILMSPEAQDVRAWLGHFVSAKVVLPERLVNDFDVVNMTTAQLQDALNQAEQRRTGLRTQANSFNEARMEQVRNAARQREQQDQNRQQVLARRAANDFFPNYQSQYTPRPRNNVPIERGIFGGMGFGIGIW